MKLYVMRHGPAEDDTPSGRDEDRSLTVDGRLRVRRVSKILLDHGEAPLEILSSPLARSLQTAEIVAEGTSLIERSGMLGVRREIAPGGSLRSLVTELLEAGRKRVMVVGHEPDLSNFIEESLGPLAEGMLKAMVVGLSIEHDDRTGTMRPFAARGRFILNPKSQEWLDLSKTMP
jgi:phosphohistidine phosphatase